MATSLDKLKAKQDFAKEADRVAQGPKIEIRRKVAGTPSRVHEVVEEPAAQVPVEVERQEKKPTAGQFQWTAFISVDYKKKLAFLKATSGHTYKELMEEALDYLCEKYKV